MAKANETQVPTETEQNNLKIFDKVSNSVNINHKNCSYCSKPFTEELWCKECDPRHMIEDWTSGNNDVDKFIKDTIYDIRNINNVYNAQFLEWVPYHLIAEYNSYWVKKEPKPIKVALKRLNGSENMSVEYLNELKINWNYHKANNRITLKFYGMTKDPETEEFMMILEFTDK
ncbi:uncharacterized protein OCT59_017766 [Rhizophagus irregularis]|uniref:uncharacterized protein n=1 Tax=Rhizophagus irregularis TaxID=588596 RepID=UPI00331B80BB|nr:hypothetical protein OCT59_017766 [Rhizophagus irregularis]